MYILSSSVIGYDFSTLCLTVVESTGKKLQNLNFEIQSQMSDIEFRRAYEEFVEMMNETVKS